MKHVDETLLHALLDGQLEALAAAGGLPEGVDRRWIEDHVRTCAQCRAQLDQERMIRDGAALVLRDAALATVDVPPFEMVAPEQPQTVVPSRRRTIIPMAWAATVVLALGAGWWGSTLLRQEQPTLALDQSPPAVADAARAREAVGRASTASTASPVATAAEAGDAAAAAAAEGTPQGSRAEGTLAAREPTMGDGRPPSDGQVAAAVPITDSAVSAAEPRMAAATLPEVTVAEVTAPRNTIAAPAPAADMAVSRLADAQPGAQRARTGSSASRILEEPAAAAPEPAAFHDAVRAVRQDRLAWTAVDPGDAATAGVTLVTIAGMSPLEMEYASLADGGSVARVIQPLDDDARLELLIWRNPTASPDTAAPGTAQAKTETAGLPVVVVSGTDAPRGPEVLAYLPSLGAYVLLSGDIDPRRLAALAERLVVIP